MSKLAKLTEFIGNQKIVEQIKYLIDVASMKGEQMPHLLLAGSPGAGKTTMANIIANEANKTYIRNIKVPWGNNAPLNEYMNTYELFEKETRDKLETIRITKTTGPSLRSNGALEDILYAATSGDFTIVKNDSSDQIQISKPKFLFIDEAHAMPKRVMDALLMVMEEFTFYPTDAFDADEDFEIPRFCCIMATTNPGSLSTALLSRFGAILTFEDYLPEDLTQIVKNHIKSKEKGTSITDEAAKEISTRAQGIIRSLIHHTDKCYDMMLMNNTDINKKEITKKHTDKMFNMFGIDSLGLTSSKEILIMKILAGSFPKSVGIKSLGELAYMDKEYILKDVEPYLCKLKFVNKVPNGRVLTRKGLDYLVKNEHVQQKRTLADLRR